MCTSEVGSSRQSANDITDHQRYARGEITREQLGGHAVGDLEALVGLDPMSRRTAAWYDLQKVPVRVLKQPLL
jgi:hypothetical protein